MYIDGFLWVHVTAGALSLLIGLFVFLTKKGTKRHIQLGKFYYACMTIVFVTATYVSSVRSNLFLLLIGFFSFYLVHSGIRHLKIQQKSDIKLMDKLSTLIFGGCFLAMLILAFIAFFNSHNTALAIILAVFGGIGLSLSLNDVRVFLLSRVHSASKWRLKEHIGRMTGSYIAAFTAFAVNNIHFLPTVVIWLLPTLLGFILIAYYNRTFKLN